MDVDEQQLLRTVTRVANTLHAHGIRFAVAGGCAVYAHGGPASEHDVDIFLKENDAIPARNALVASGLRAVDPPEDWLTKAYDGDCLVDLIFRPNQRDVTDEMLDDAVELRIGPTCAAVMSATSVVIDKLQVLDPHRCDFTPLLPIVRALREQVDWRRVAKETGDSPYARAFLRLAADLDVIGAECLARIPAHPKGAADARAS
ncbi:MAG: nucleotidyltransferase [Haloechinothrix sp.]